jgi:phenylacetate-CoA ligase
LVHKYAEPERTAGGGATALSLSETFVRVLGNRLWLAYKRQSGIMTWKKRLEPLWCVEREELASIQLASLRAILVHASDTTRHYANVFSQLGFSAARVGTCEEIRQLPFLNKEDLNSNMDDFLSRKFAHSDLVSSSTGGSSGVSLTFYRDRRVQDIRRAQDYLFNARLGIYPGMKRAWVWGSRIDAFSLATLRARITNFLTERAIYFYAYDSTPDRIDEFLQRVIKHRPRVIIAYPNMLATMAKRAQERSLVIPGIERIIVTAEPLYGWQRRLFGEVFSAETFERYGAREIGTVASECVLHTGMHLFEPAYYLEVVDEQGREVAEGQMGELVVTDFYNYAMPLIRYRSGDMVRLDSATCACGCTWRRITGIGGRVVDMIVRPDGSKVEGLVIINALHTCGFRARVQVVQKSTSSLLVRCLASDSIPPDTRSRFLNRMREVLGAQLEVAYEPVEQLRYEQSGKYRYVICECDRDTRSVGR